MNEGLVLHNKNRYLVKLIKKPAQK